MSQYLYSIHHHAQPFRSVSYKLTIKCPGRILDSLNLDAGGFTGKPLPVLLWHGMGDSCCNEYSIGAVAKRIQKALPGLDPQYLQQEKSPIIHMLQSITRFYIVPESSNLMV